MNRPILWLTGVLISVILIFYTFYTDLCPNPLAENMGTDREVMGEVCSDIKTKSTTIGFTLRVMSVDGQPIKQSFWQQPKIQVTLAHSKNDPAMILSPGDLIKLTGELSMPDRQRNPGGFDYATYLKGQGISALCYVKRTDPPQILGRKPSLNGAVSHLRAKLSATCDQALSPEQSDLVKGVLLGDKNIDPDIRTLFSDAGLAHIMAISGLHVGYIAALLAFITTLIQLKPRHRLALMVFCLILYVWLTGAAASVIRAAIMILALMVGEIAHEKTDALSGLCLAADLILVMAPAQLFAAGFQLSFSAVLGIILLQKPLCHQWTQLTGSRPGWIMQSLILTVSTTIFTLPAMLYHFHTLNLISLFSNILMVPLVGFLVILSLILIPLMTLLPGTMGLLSWILGSVAQVVLDLTQLFTRIPGLKLNHGAMNWAAVGLVVLGALSLAGYFNFKKKSVRISVIIIGGGLIAALLVPLGLPKPLTVTVLDVGQGDATLIETPQGGAYLIDGGGYESDYGSEDRIPISEKVLLPALYARDIHRLNGVFISHNHADHTQGIEELLAVFPIDQIYVSTKYNNAALMKQNIIPVSILSRGMTLSTKDGVTFQILWPDGLQKAAADDEQNEASMVIKILYGYRSFLFMGDAGIQTEPKLSNVEADVIKIGHHGSKTATGAAFINRVHPSAAVISVGLYNTFGHPTQEVLSTIEQSGAACFRTDQQGAITLTTDGETLTVEPSLQ